MKTSLYLLALIMLLAAPAHAEVTYTLDEDYGNVPVTFVPNVGQFDDSIVFAAEGNNGGVFNDDEGLIFELAPEAVKLWPPDAAYDYKTYLQFRDANANPEVTFEDQAPWNNNYFIGNDSANWHTDVPNYRTVRFSEIYPGIDLTMTGEGRVIVSSIIVEPHGDPSQIHFPGGGSRTVDEDGNLCVEFYRDPEIASSRSYVYEPPECFQYIDGEERVIALTYKVIDVPVNDFLTFDIGEYDPAHELIIKPGPVYSPLMLVRSATGIADIVIDDEDCAYVAGGAVDIFPTTGEIIFRTPFTMKLNKVGDKLEYVTYFGGSIINAGNVTCCDVDSEGNLFVAGNNISSDFPSTIGAFDTIIESGGKSYILKLNDMGNNLIYATYLGGNGSDYIHEIKTDESGILFVAGKTASTDFPTTDGVYDNSFNWNSNGFISKLSSDGSELLHSTFIEFGWFETIDLFNSEVLYGGIGYGNVFVGKMKYDLSDTLYTIWINGSDHDYVTGMDICSKGNIYVTGYTESDDFYTTDESEFHGENDCFITKVSTDGSLIWSILIGGSGDDVSKDISIDNEGNAYITGKTSSSNFPATSTGKNGIGQFLTIINSEGSNFIYSTTTGNSTGYGLSLDSDLNVFLFGYGWGEDLNSNLIIENPYFLYKLKRSDETFITNEDNKQEVFTVHPAYPNPFNPSVSISYYLPQTEHVIVKIYNLQGQLVDTLVNEYQKAGKHIAIWNAKRFASGVYLYHIEAENNVQTGKLLRMK